MEYFDFCCLNFGIRALSNTDFFQTKVVGCPTSRPHEQTFFFSIFEKRADFSIVHHFFRFRLTLDPMGVKISKRLSSNMS